MKSGSKSYIELKNDDGSPTPPTCCFSFTKSSDKKIPKSIMKKLNTKWHSTTYTKINDTFRVNNQTTVPEWLDGF